MAGSTSMPGIGTGRGRGRGRGILATTSSQLGYFPGKDIPKATIDDSSSSVRKITDIIQSMSVSDNEKDMKDIEEIFVKNLHSDEHVKQVVDAIYSKCMNSHNFCPCMVKLCNTLSQLENTGPRLRKKFLGNVQNDFKDREDYHTTSSQKFLGLILILCNAFNSMKLHNGDHFKVLTDPILKCFNLILDSTQDQEEEIVCMSSQMFIIGKDLERLDENASDFRKRIRAKIISDKSTPQTRQRLLEVIECWATGWEKQPVK